MIRLGNTTFMALRLSMDSAAGAAETKMKQAQMKMAILENQLKFGEICIGSIFLVLQWSFGGGFR